MAGGDETRRGTNQRVREMRGCKWERDDEMYHVHCRSQWEIHGEGKRWVGN